MPAAGHDRADGIADMHAPHTVLDGRFEAAEVSAGTRGESASHAGIGAAAYFHAVAHAAISADI